MAILTRAMPMRVWSDLRPDAPAVRSCELKPEFSDSVISFFLIPYVTGVSRAEGWVRFASASLGGGTHTLLIGHVLKSDRAGVAGCSMSGQMRLRVWVLLVFVRPCRRREEVPDIPSRTRASLSQVYVGLDLDTLFDSGHECATVQTRVRAIQDRLPDLRRRATDSYSRAQPYDSGLRDLGIIGSKKCPTAGEQQRTRREATGTRLSARAHYLSICLDTVISAPPMRARPHSRGDQSGRTVPSRASVAYTHTHLHTMFDIARPTTSPPYLAHSPIRLLTY